MGATVIRLVRYEWRGPLDAGQAVKLVDPEGVLHACWSTAIPHRDFYAHWTSQREDLVWQVRTL